MPLQRFEEQSHLLQAGDGVLLHSVGKRLGKEGEEGVKMGREVAVDHLCVDVLTDQLHVATDVPELLPDLEVFLLPLLLLDIQSYPSAPVVFHNVLVIFEGCSGFLVAPLSALKWLYGFDNLKVLHLQQSFPA